MKRLLHVFICIISLSYFSSVIAQENNKKLKLNGDFRFRIEHDSKNVKFNGSTKDSRQRLRYRLRFGFKYQWSNKTEFGARLRSGSMNDQQSPHHTFGNEFEKTSLGIDKAYIKGKHGRSWYWAGKNNYPFYKTSELFWDDDVNPEGIAIGTSFGNKIKITPTAGYFISRHSGFSLSEDGYVTGLGIKLQKNGNIKFEVGSTILAVRNMLNLDKGKYVNEYTLSHSSLQFKYITKNNIAISIGAEYMLNLSNYSQDTLIIDGLQDEKTGIVGFLKIGKNKWQLRYYYSVIEKYAVVDYFAQDDYLRWGGGTYGTTASNFKGHEYRFTYKFGPQYKLVTRYYIVNGLKEAIGGNNYKSGNRFRIDLNIGF